MLKLCEFKDESFFEVTDGINSLIKIWIERVHGFALLDEDTKIGIWYVPESYIELDFNQELCDRLRKADCIAFTDI